VNSTPTGDMLLAWFQTSAHCAFLSSRL